MIWWCRQKNKPCSMANENGYCQISACCNTSTPTVKAIPIEWLMKKADEWATKDITYDGKPYMFTAQQVGLAIALMVNDWEKENANK